MARCRMVISAICAHVAIKPFLDPLIDFTTVAMGVLNKFVKFYKLIVKAVVCVELAARLNSPTIDLLGNNEKNR